MSSTAKERLIESAACTAVFALVLGMVVSCGGGGSVLSGIMGTTSKLPVVRILSHLSPTSAALPLSSTQPPLITMSLQSSQQQASTIQQSFQGLSCNAFVDPLAIVNWSGASTGFIPLQVMGDPFIVNGSPSSTVLYSTICWGVFAQAGGGTSLVAPGGTTLGAGTLTNPGTPVYADGTLSILIVTGISVGGQQIRCSDLTDTAAVHDGDLVQPYFVIDTNSVVLAVGSTQLPLTCQLNIAPGDQAGSLSVQWAKI